jgi:hypothetical protein
MIKFEGEDGLDYGGLSRYDRRAHRLLSASTLSICVHWIGSWLIAMTNPTMFSNVLLRIFSCYF